MRPKLVDPSRDIGVAPQSFVFALLKDFKAPTCMKQDTEFVFYYF